MYTAGTPGLVVNEGLHWPLRTNSLVVVFDHPEEVQEFLKMLENEHIEGMVETAAGMTGADEIRWAFSRQSAFDRLFSHLNGEDDFACMLEDEAERGAAVVLVSTRPEHLSEVMAMLSSFHPELVEAKGRWVRHEMLQKITPNQTPA
jgi:hypothetical protein